MKIYIEQHPNKENRTFHTSENFANRPHVTLGNIYYREPEKPYAKRLVAFSKSLSILKEVDDVSVSKNRIDVTRNPTYSWDEVERAIVPKIEKYFRQTATVELQEREEWMDKPPRDDYPY